MTTHYGVWSDEAEEWWNVGNGVFHTMMMGLAKAQAMVTRAIWKKVVGERMGWHWEVRAIGEDGLPASEPPLLTEEQKRTRLRAASHECAVCEDVATKFDNQRRGP